MSAADRRKRSAKRKHNREEIRASLDDQGLKHNLRNILAERGDRYYKKHHAELAKWQNFRNSEPKEVNVSVYGNPIPLSYGTFRHKCDIIWTTGIQPDALNDSEVVATGAGNGDVAFQERYKASWAVKICEGEQGALLRVWMNRELVFDFSAEQGDGYTSHPNFASKMVYYPGSETQTANPTIEADKGVGNVQAFRGTAYLVFTDIPLGRFGNEIPEVEAEVCATATPNYTTYDVADFETDTDHIENFVVARNSSKLYHYTPDLLSIVRRGTAILSQTVNVQDYLDDHVASGCDATGIIAIDDVGGRRHDPVYLPCQDGTGAAFFVRYDGTFANSYDDRIAGATFERCFVNNSKLYAADGPNSKIYCFDKTSLALLWVRNGNTTGSFEAGNFTVDGAGFVWVVWFDGGDPDSLFLSKISHGGIVKNYTFSTPSGLGALGIIYDTEANVFLTGGVAGNKISKVSNANPPTILDTLSGKTGDNCGPLFTAQYRFAKSSYWCDGTNIYRIKTTALQVRETIALSNYSDTGTGTEAYGFGYLEKAFWICRDAAPNLSKLPLNRSDRFDNNLDDIVQNLCLRAGIDATDLDVTGLSVVTVAGFVVPDRVPAKDPLELLLAAYQIGVREHYENAYGSDGIKLEFVLRADESSTGTVEEEDLGMGEGEPEEQPLAEERINEEDLPSRVNVRYADVRRAYDSHVQKSSIPPDITSATRQYNLDFPDLVLTDDEAKQLADKILAITWAEDTNVVFTCGLKYLYIEPEDIITVTYSGVDKVVRVETVELGENFILQISGVVCDLEAYTSESTGSAAEEALHPVRVMTESTMVLVDCPAVRDADGMPDDAGFYAFACPQVEDEDWLGCRVSRSKDGIVFAHAATFTESSSIAVAVTALNNGDVNSFDPDSTMIIRPIANGAFEGDTESGLYGDGLLNLAAIGSEENGWELVQFASVEANGDGTISLTGMIRGRFGTERFIDTHEIGDLVCVFDFTTPSTLRIKLPLSDRGLESLYKVVTLGASLASAVERPFTNSCVSLTPYSILEESVVAAHNEPSANDWTVNWTRRTRLGFELQDYDDTAVNEEDEEWQLLISDTPDGDPVRTVTVGPGLPVTTGINLAIASNAVTRGSGSFLTDGFLVGQWVDLSGWATADNNRRYQISVLSALSMTLDGTLTNESSGAGRVVQAATPAFCYTSAQQTADGGAKSSFYLTFYQISQRLRENDGIGRGFSTQVHIF